MRLSQCTHGIIVESGGKVGMIVGITNNVPHAEVGIRSEIDRAIPLVKWSGESEPRGVHHSGLSIFKGDI